MYNWLKPHCFGPSYILRNNYKALVLVHSISIWTKALVLIFFFFFNKALVLLHSIRKNYKTFFIKLFYKGKKKKKKRVLFWNKISNLYVEQRAQKRGGGGKSNVNLVWEEG